MPKRRYCLMSLTLCLAAMISCGAAGCGSTTGKVYPTAEEQFRQAMKDYQKKGYLRAIDGFQKVVFNFSGAPMVDSAQYFLAMSQYGLKDYYVAATEFERLVNTYPGSPFVDDGQYMTGLCYFKAAPRHYGLDQQELERAITALEDFVTDHPESEAAADAKATLKAAHDRLAQKRYEGGRMYMRLGYFDSAKIYFQAVIDEYTGSPWAARALFHLGEIALREKAYQDARTKFNYFLVVYPDHPLAAKARKMLDKIGKEGDERTENK